MAGMQDTASSRFRCSSITPLSRLFFPLSVRIETHSSLLALTSEVANHRRLGAVTAIRRVIGMEFTMSTFNPDDIDFSAHLIAARTEAHQKMEEARLMMQRIDVRALASFDIVGKLNTLGAERVVQIGDHNKVGTQMFVIDENDHGTLLSFDGRMFDWVCWDDRFGNPEIMGVAVRSAVQLNLRSWDTARRYPNANSVISRVLFRNYYGSKDLYEYASLAKDIRDARKLPRIMDLTPEVWWENIRNSFKGGGGV